MSDPEAPDPRLAAEYVKWMCGDKSVREPGSFYKALNEATMRADPENRARLSVGFPVTVTAWTIYHQRGLKDLDDWVVASEHLLAALAKAAEERKEGGTPLSEIVDDDGNLLDGDDGD